MSRRSVPPVLSEQCALAQRFEYLGLHADCRQIHDIQLPYSMGVVLVPRCGCDCHARAGRAS